jgi:hypothetical protein
MGDNASMTLKQNGPAALARMEQALELLDACDAPGEVGANLDLAICRLRELLQRRGASLAAMGPRRVAGF